MDASGNLSANGTADSELAEPRGPGAPKGRPKPPGSGRQKGVRNKITREIRAVAGKYTLRAVRQAWKLATEAKNQETQLKALELILAYGHGKPSQTTLIGGTGEDPVRVQQAADLMLDDRELARRIALILSLGDPVYREVADAERAARGGNDQDFAESLAAPEVPAGESDGSGGSDNTPAGEKAPQEPTESAEESAEPTPPPEGKSLWFGLLEVQNVGPCREGLPSMYVVRRGEKEIKRGNWDTSLAQVRKLIGEPLPPGRLAETRPDGALSWPSLPREQRP